MTQIKFYADGQRLEINGEEPLIVEKSKNEYEAAFTFSDDWADINEKAAVFRRFSDNKSFTVGLDEQDKCVIPWEVLQTPRFYVSAYGGNLRTMTELSLSVEKSGYDENAGPSGTVPQPIPTPTDLKIENGVLQLTAKGEAVGNGVELPEITVDTELSDTSENPVQNKVLKVALDTKLDNSAGSVKGVNLADGCVSWNHIGNGQVTTPAIAESSIYTRHITNKNITEEKLSDEVVKKLNSGVKQINKITLDETTQGALSIKITQDNLGNAFSLSNAVITAHLNIDISQKVGTQYQIRIVANKGRFLFFKSGLVIRPYADVMINSNYDKNTGMTLSMGTYVWSDSPNISTGSSPTANYPSLCNTPDGNAPIEEIEVMVIESENNQRLPLLSGSFLNIKGE